jgi:hypothetical protein
VATPVAQTSAFKVRIEIHHQQRADNFTARPAQKPDRAGRAKFEAAMNTKITR